MKDVLVLANDFTNVLCMKLNLNSIYILNVKTYHPSILISWTLALLTYAVYMRNLA